MTSHVSHRPATRASRIAQITQITRLEREVDAWSTAALAPSRAADPRCPDDGEGRLGKVKALEAQIAVLWRQVRRVPWAGECHDL